MVNFLFAPLSFIYRCTYIHTNTQGFLSSNLDLVRGSLVDAVEDIEISRGVHVVEASLVVVTKCGDLSNLLVSQLNLLEVLRDTRWSDRFRNHTVVSDLRPGETKEIKLVSKSHYTIEG